MCNNLEPHRSFQSLPSVPEPKVGISTRTTNRTIAVGGTGAARASPLLSLRNTATGTAPKLGVQVRPTHPSPLGSLGAGTLSLSLSPALPNGTSSSGLGTPGLSLLQPRANPHRLFIREPPPSTEAAGNGSSPSPALTPARNMRAAWTPAADATPHNPFAGFNRGEDEDGGERDQHAATPQPVRPAAQQQQQQNGVGPASVQGAAYMPQLGRLAAEGYSFEPSPTQLEAMYASDPASLRKVHNFTVSRPDMGSIRWLQPVDVTGLKLDGVVTIQHGEAALPVSPVSLSLLFAAIRRICCPCTCAAACVILPSLAPPG